MNRLIKSLAIIIVLLFSFLTIMISIHNNSNIPNLNENIVFENNITNSNEIVIPEETKQEVNNVIKQTTEQKQDLSTTEIIEGTEIEEHQVIDEGALEPDAVVEQENISYDGDYSGNGLNLLGAYQGLTYYSQADSRWANIMYSSTGKYSQTMKSSACGPTSAAMVVSSAKGTILPTTMASLAVSNGYRTANNGTAWSYYPFVADYFDFKEYYTTSNFYTMTSYLKQKKTDGSSKYFVIASCGSGLFTTSGHYIVLVADNNGVITVYDPYLYAGKFSTASRRAAGVVVSGNSAYVTENAFKTYANYKYFWIYSNDAGTNQGNASIPSTVSVSYTRYVATQSANLNVRNAPNGKVISSLRKGTAVRVTGVSGLWSKISSPVNGWVSTNYLSSTNVAYAPTISYSTSKGTYYRLKANTTLYANSSMRGTAYNYLKGTQIKVLSHISSNIDYIYVTKTGRYAYCYTSAYGSYTTAAAAPGSKTRYSTSIGNYYNLKVKTNLYSRGSLSGITYNYLPKTRIKVISHYSNSVDYIYVVKTGRYAYCRVSAYK